MPFSASLRRLCALFILTHTIHTSLANTVTLPLLQVRDQKSDSSCQAIDPALPSDFKCSSGSSCVSLDNSSSALCCPPNETCNQIQPISCNAQLQNATANPNSPIFTTKLGNSLAQCGTSTCCPFGYNCLAAGKTSICQLNVDTSHSGVINSTSSATVSLAVPTATSSSSSTSSLSGINSNQHLPPAKCNKFPAGVFFAGFFPGIFIGALGALAWVILTGRRGRESETDRDSVQSVKKALVISAPLPHPQSGSRADFLRRGMARTKSVFSTKSGRAGTDSNPWHTETPTPPVPNNMPPQAVMPVTPNNQVGRPQSTESIKIFSPPGMLQHPSATIAPLRTMQTQRGQPEADFGSPFRTPPKPSHDNYNYNDPPYLETLAPQRYNNTAAKGKQREVESDHDPNRDTSFTTMLEHCRIPDRGDEFPVPKVPKQYQGMPYETRI